jgi:hypothetical protein
MFSKGNQYEQSVPGSGGVSRNLLIALCQGLTGTMARSMADGVFLEDERDQYSEIAKIAKSRGWQVNREVQLRESNTKGKARALDFVFSYPSLNTRAKALVGIEAKFLGQGKKYIDVKKDVHKLTSLASTERDFVHLDKDTKRKIPEVKYRSGFLMFYGYMNEVGPGFSSIPTKINGIASSYWYCRSKFKLHRKALGVIIHRVV